MSVQKNIDYDRVAKAIDFIRANFKTQPTLDEVAAHVHLSPYHFQKLFTDWAGVSPKKFLQYITIEYAKSMLNEKQPSLFDAAMDSGLSSTSRLHDLFVNIEGMTPGEYKNGGKGLTIKYSIYDTPFGKIIVASTSKGVCYMGFTNTNDVVDLVRRFPNSEIVQQSDEMHQHALAVFTQNWSELKKVKLHLKGTPFQIKVWNALVNIPLGQLTTYGDLATEIGSPKASRAVGTAVGSNPIAFLIPCHRVIRSSGVIGDYMWGSTRKTALIGWEASKVNTE